MDKEEDIFSSPAHDPLAAIPEVPEGVELIRTRKGDLCLQRPLPEKRRLSGWIMRTFGWRKDIRIALDEPGAFFIEQADGSNDLQTIAEAMQRKFSWQPDQARKAIVEYTQQLMRRGLIGLRLKR